MKVVNRRGSYQQATAQASKKAEGEKRKSPCIPLREKGKGKERQTGFFKETVFRADARVRAALDADLDGAERQLFRQLDTPFREHVRELRWWRAMNALKGRPELQRTLRAIRRHRVREKIFSALKIGAGTYRERFSQLTQILKISI